MAVSRRYQSHSTLKYKVRCRSFGHHPVVDLGIILNVRVEINGSAPCFELPAQRTVHRILRLRLVPQALFHPRKRSVSPFIYVNADLFHPPSPLWNTFVLFRSTLCWYLMRTTVAPSPRLEKDLCALHYRSRDSTPALPMEPYFPYALTDIPAVASHP